MQQALAPTRAAGDDNGPDAGPGGARHRGQEEDPGPRALARQPKERARG